MCKFCEYTNKKESKEFTWNTRSTYVDDNIYDYLYEINDYNHVEEFCYFELIHHKIDGNTHVGITYHQEIRGKVDIVIAPFSNRIQFNFCPFCGEQISKDIRKFEDNYHIKADEEDEV